MKLLIWTGIVAGGGLGAWIGSTFDQSDFLGFWSIILGGVGSLLGIWAGYRLGKYMGY